MSAVEGVSVKVFLEAACGALDGPRTSWGRFDSGSRVAAVSVKARLGRSCRDVEVCLHGDGELLLPDSASGCPATTPCGGR